MDVFAKVLCLGILRSRPVAEEDSLVQLLVGEMLVNRDRALGARDWITDQVVLDFLDADDVGDDVLDDEPLLLGPYSSGQVYPPASHRDLHVVRIECELFLETIANQRAQLAISQLVDLVDVLVILFHRSSESAASGGSGYRKNRSDAPSVRARLFFQKDRACPPPTAAVPVVGVK